MKVLQLRQLIHEEVRNTLNEAAKEVVLSKALKNWKDDYNADETK